MKISTKEFENRIERAESVADLKNIMSDLPGMTFTVRMDELCRKYQMTFSQVQVESGITKSLFYAIMNGTRNPKKIHVLKIGLALGISKDEMNELLKLAGLKELYPKNKEDLIILYGLNHHLSLMKMEELLCEEGCDLHLIEL